MILVESVFGRRHRGGRRRGGFFLAWLPVLAAACAAPVAERAEGPPHVVVFLADDLGWDSTGFNGGPHPTPSIDRIARQGVRFDQFYVQPLCTATRAALLTGRYPIRYGLQVGVINLWDPIGLPAEERTLAQVLDDVGYRTAIVGKWHLGSAREEFLPTRRGFDHQYGNYSATVDYFTHRPKIGGLDWHRDDRPAREDGHATELTAREAVRLIDDHPRGTPLFLYVPFLAAHMPRTVPEEYERRFARIADEKDRLYAATLAQLDDAVGRVLDALERRGMLDDTLVVFTCDNGTDYTAGPLRGGKGSLYEGAMRVPAAMMWPRRLSPGGVVDTPVHVTDLFTTVARLAGADTEGLELDGVDAWPAIAEGRASARREILHHLVEGRGALREGPWKLVVRWAQTGDGEVDADRLEAVELFRIDRDPYEENDLSNAHPDVVARLADRLRVYHAESVPPLKAARSHPPPGFDVPEVWGPLDERTDP